MIFCKTFGCWDHNILAEIGQYHGCRCPGSLSGHFISNYSSLDYSQMCFTISTLRLLRQNVCHFPNDTFKCIFLNENIWILINISWKFVHEGRIDNITALVQVMAWHRPGDKPLSEPMIILLTHICATRHQWVNEVRTNTKCSFFCSNKYNAKQNNRCFSISFSAKFGKWSSILTGFIIRNIRSPFFYHV